MQAHVTQNVKPLAYYFYMKTKILLDVHICISEPLNEDEDEDDLSPIPPLKDDKVNSEPNETIAKKVKLCCKIINA